MKKLLALTILAASTVGVLAQTNAPVVLDTNEVAGYIVNQAAHHQWLATVLLLIGALRVPCKLIMTVLDKIVADKPDSQEAIAAAKLESSPIYKLVAFVLDWGASIKVGPARNLALPLNAPKPIEPAQIPKQ